MFASSRLTAGGSSHCVVSLSKTLEPLLSTGSTSDLISLSFRDDYFPNSYRSTYIRDCRYHTQYFKRVEDFVNSGEEEAAGKILNILATIAADSVPCK